jgi:hypothetical protein
MYMPPRRRSRVACRLPLLSRRLQPLKRQKLYTGFGLARGSDTSRPICP